MKLTRTFHPVGQGAFYSETMQDDEERQVFNVVYDCGSESGKSGLNREIADYCSIHSEIDALFVSHFHNDHVNGILDLIHNCNVKRIFIPIITTEVLIDSFIYNMIEAKAVQNAANAFIRFCVENRQNSVVSIRDFRLEDIPIGIYSERRKDIEIIETGIELGISIVIDDLWEYIPCNIRNQNAADFAAAFQQRFQNLFDNFAAIRFDEIEAYFADAQNFADVRDFYNSFYRNRDRNEQSMVVLSKPVRLAQRSQSCCLFTGDMPLRRHEYLEGMRRYYSSDWCLIETLQSPHHGAANDNPRDLFDVPRSCVICCGKNNRYRHPGVTTLNNMADSGSVVYHVQGNPLDVFCQVVYLQPITSMVYVAKAGGIVKYFKRDEFSNWLFSEKVNKGVLSKRTAENYSVYVGYIFNGRDITKREVSHFNCAMTYYQEFLKTL